MVRIWAPQRFAVGTRVANPLEGRTGHIDAYDADTGVYSLLFHDGHREECDEASAEKFVIKTPPTASDTAAASSSSSSDAVGDGGSTEDPYKLIGAEIPKTATSYNDQKIVLLGYVSSYFDDVKKYRVGFSDGTVQELSVEDAKNQVEAHLKAQAAAKEQENSEKKKRKKRENEDEHGDKPKKKYKKHVAEHETESNKEKDNGGGHEEEVQLNCMKYPSRTAAYTIIRKVLCVILAQNAIKKMRTEKQIAVLNNEDIKPKRALENFAEAGGLTCLQKVLVIWMRNPQTHPGVLLILKVLATLPGVTSDLVLQSNIGRTLRGIANACQTMGHVDQVLGDLAEWIIRSWKRNVIQKGLNMSTKDMIKENSSELLRSASVPLLYVPPPPTSEKHMTEKQVMTNHLRRLLTATVTEKDAEEDDEEEEIILPRFNSLGSEDARRPRRQAILIDSLASRINREHDEGLKIHQQRLEAEAKAQAEAATAGGGGEAGESGATAGGIVPGTILGRAKSIWDADGKDEVAIGRLKFGRPQILQFNRNIAVVNLMATARTRIFAKQQTMGLGDDNGGLDNDDEDDVPIAELPLPNKTAAPKKSILKTSDEEVIPASQVKWA
uniref:Uncharacterized protein n=1 Tax=Globisporangium ultimum (strain ATCC 200006 / CBS 805.95 / DAOM BR144) TaxID=431595 RepID=K3WNH3_GLOUD